MKLSLNENKFMAKRILIFEDRLTQVNQISSNEFHYYSVMEFPEIVSFIYTKEIDLLILKGDSCLKYFSKILELRNAKSKNAFPIAICNSNLEMLEDLKSKNPLTTFFSTPSSNAEWNNLSSLIIENYQNRILSHSKYQKEIEIQQKKNGRLERELSMRYFIDHEKIHDIQRLLNSIGDFEETSMEEWSQKSLKLKMLLTRLLRMDKSWRKFVLHFERVCPSFTKRLLLKYPNLSQNDLRLCAYIKIGTTNKEISVISNINEGSVRKTLNRMKKKMDLTKEDDLRFYIHQIDS